MRAKMIFTILMLFFFTFALTGVSLAGERKDDRRDFRFDRDRFERDRFDREEFFGDFFFDDDFFLPPRFFAPRFPVFAPRFFGD